MKLESLEELRVFTQIVESGSLTAAARALGMPPTTISRRLAALEERLGTQLLYRTTRSQSLSETGRALLTSAQRILSEVESAELTLQQETEGLTGIVRISAVSVLTRDIMLALKPLMSKHPGLHIQLKVNDRPVNPVTEGLDVVLMGGQLGDSTLIARKLMDIHLVTTASEDYLREYGAPQTPAELSEHHILRFATEPPQTSWVLTGPDGEEHVVPINGRFEVDTGRTLADALCAGLGIGATSLRVMRTLPELRRVLPDYKLSSFPFYAIYPASRQRSVRVQTVVDTIQAFLQDVDRSLNE